MGGMNCVSIGHGDTDMLMDGLGLFVVQGLRRGHEVVGGAGICYGV